MQDIKTLFTMIKQMREILTTRQKRRMVGVFVVILLGSLAELIGITAILPFIQAIMTPHEFMKKSYIHTIMDIFNVSTEKGMILLIGCIIMTIYFIKNVFLIFVAYVQTKFTCDTKKEISLLMYSSYIARPYSFFVGSDSGEIMRGVNQDSDSVYIVVQHIFKFITEILNIIVIAVYLIYTDAVMALGVLAIGFITFLFILVFIKKRISVAGIQVRESNADVSSWTVQSIQGIKDIFVFGKKEYAAKRYDELYAKAVKAETTSDFISLIPDRIIEAFCITGIIAMIMIRISMGVDVNEFVPALSIFAVGAFKILPSISHATGYVSVFIYKRPAIEGAHENIVNARKYMQETEKLVTKSDDESIDFNRDIKVDNISWQYDGSKKKVLDNLSLTINKGEVIGIIGESGSGKSTLSDILLHLYRPQNGIVKMDDVDINTIPNSWNRLLSYVPQSVFLLNDTIRENVLFGEDRGTDTEVWEALEKAHLKDYVRELPDGLDTVVGERGVRFSGGQRQRIAIARALYTNPEILILDEATSALDNETETAVMESIEHLSGSVTMIIIAHRVTTLKCCDKIYEITGGKAILKDKESIVK